MDINPYHCLYLSYKTLNIMKKLLSFILLTLAMTTYANNFLSYTVGYTSDEVEASLMGKTIRIGSQITVSYVKTETPTLFFDKGTGYYLLGTTFLSDGNKTSSNFCIGKDKKTALKTLKKMKEVFLHDSSKMSINVGSYSLFAVRSGTNMNCSISYAGDLECEALYCVTPKNIDDMITMIKKNK